MSNDQELKLRRNLKRKVKPAIEDPAQVPMSVYYLIVKYSNGLFKKFTQLSVGFRKHLLYHLFTEYLQPISNGFLEIYQRQGLEVISRYLTLTPITFCNEAGTRLDAVLTVSVAKKASQMVGKSVALGCTYQLDNDEADYYKSTYRFDLYKKGSKRWLWLHKDECLVSASPYND